MSACAGLSLLTDPWLPVTLANGQPTIIAPADIVDGRLSAPSVDLAWPRADLRVACRELLVGLVASCCPPEDDAAWEEWWHHPPSPAQLQALFAPFAAAFVLDGPGPRFCQDHEDFPGPAVPVERLLIDAPGGNTLLKNADLLVKRGRVPVLGRAAAAMALYTLQAFAPSGGAGHRTSLRGGGPLTTLVIPPADPAHPLTLWHLVWANVPNGRAPKAAEHGLVFPWLAPTRCSNPADPANRGTTLDGTDAHPLQAFWGMPRRIRLDFRPARPSEVCALTGQPDRVMIDSFRTRPWGVQYINAAIQHPLTPTYRTKPGEPPLSVHPQPDGIGYRHWAGLVAPDRERSLPATAVKNFLDRRPWDGGEAWHEARLLIAGYDMDNMKARNFIEAEMPLFPAGSTHALAHRLGRGAMEAAGALRQQLRLALHIADSDATPIDAIRSRFFEATTEHFWVLLRAAARGADPDSVALAQDWLVTLRRAAFDLFDTAAPLDPLDPRAVSGRDGTLPPVVAARRGLGLALSGYGRTGEALFAVLELPLPAEGKKKVRQNAK